MNQLEYAYFQENFEIYQFKHKSYGCGKWAKTYEEAHQAAKTAVLKMCLEENPHLANVKPVAPAPTLTADKMLEINSEHSQPKKEAYTLGTKKVTVVDEATNIINSIMECPDADTLKKEYWLLSKSNLSYSNAYKNRLNELKDVK